MKGSRGANTFHGHIGNEDRKAREIDKEKDKQEKKQQQKKKGEDQRKGGKANHHQLQLFMGATQRMVGHHASDTTGSATKLTTSS